MSVLKDIPSVIDAFGGPTRMGEVFGVGPSAVCNWEARGWFPERIHYRLSKEAEKRGLIIANRLFEAGIVHNQNEVIPEP